MRWLLVMTSALLVWQPVHAGGPLRGSDGRPVVTLDCFYNNEWKQDTLGHRQRYHYVWSDTLDSGYSRLGDVIRSLHGRLDTLCQAPSGELLSRTDIYLIVDPDTPKETKHPAFVSDAVATTLAEWVSRGGILLLFGNDSGNAEFVHLNRLAGRFGIRFNEDSRNKVVGKNYETGTFTRFPRHPLFHDVRKIFLKEISTLTVRPPARPLLKDRGDVIIATAPYGKGLVFAVGDPWFYNEYMDHRRLPAEYDNAAAAENLFRWLFSRIQGK